MPKDDDDDAFRVLRSGRLLALSVTHVEVRLYRRSRLSSDVKRGPAHFEYYLRCTWSGPPVPDGGERWWWDPLPERYVVRRRWPEVVKFHEFVDRLQSVVGVKAKMPTLPDPGDLEAFMLGVAASGDACVLGRATPIEGTSDQLADINTIYVENRLRPYFAALSRVIDELPADALAESTAFRRLLHDGASCKHKMPPGTLKPANCGPCPVAMPQEERVMLANRLRRRGEFHGSTEPSSPAAWRKGSGGAGGELKSDRQPLPGGPASPSAASGFGGRSPAAASLSHAASAPDLDCQQGGDEDPDRPGSSPSPLSDGRRGRQRLEASHYGFFAKSFSRNLGSSSRDYWSKMRVKERRELGRRTMIRSASHLGATPERLPLLPPPGSHDLFRASVENYQRESALRHTASVQSKQILIQETSEKLLRSTVAEVTRRDVCEGLRVIVMGATPLEKRSTEERRFPDPILEDVLRVYNWYRSLLTMDEDGEADLPDVGADGAGEEGVGVPEDTPMQLAAVSWPLFFAWAQREQDFARDFRYKSVCAALNRALKLHYQHECTPKERETGATLTLLLQWVWPSVGPDWVATMLHWICTHELEKIRKATPPVIEPQDRRQLETIFANMDVNNRGYITADDLAGGKIQDIEAKLRNIVDADTIRAVVGEGDIYLPQFLELMCQDGFRGHKDATRVLQEDGVKLVLQRREAVGFEGWVTDDVDVSRWEAGHRRLIDSLEAEVLRWRRKASKVRPRGLRATLAPAAAAFSPDATMPSAIAEASAEGSGLTALALDSTSAVLAAAIR